MSNPGPLDKSRTLQTNDTVGVWINDAVGVLRSVILREVSNDPHARTVANALPEERVVEIRYREGPSRGRTAFVPERSLRTIPAQVVRETFTDWAQQTVPYRVKPNPDADDPRRRFVCEIDPHDANEWNPMGHGRSPQEALNDAMAEWRRFDQNR